MRLSGFRCLERFGVEIIPAVLPEAVAEFAEVSDVSWLQTALH